MSDAEEGSSRDIFSKVSNSVEPADSITISISFRIIRQFSLQLYDNPRRAIEELVCNSYDANAEECYVTTPEAGTDSLYVLDNGHSMDMEGLRWLWKVAASRKVEEFDENREKDGRQQIGKFGVGKLASFALGSRLTHVATKGGKTRVVSVHQDRLKEDTEDNEPFSVYEMPSDEAEELLSEYFSNLPNPWEEGWTSWTLAAISDIPEEKTGDGLEAWRLKNMIRTALPIKTNFNVILNGEKLSERDPHGELVFEIDVTDDDVIERLEDAVQSYWAKESDVEREDVDEDLYDIQRTTFPDPQDTSEELGGIIVPQLGNIAGSGSYYDRPLTTDKRRERGFKDNGFRIYVLGKLINKRDHLFGLDAQSFTAWSRFLGIFEMPGLDDVIRVQRDQVKDDPKVDLAKIVVKQVFLQIRQKRRESAGDSSGSDSGSGEVVPAHQRSFSERFKDRSRQYAYDAVSGLHPEDGEVDLDSIDIDTKPLNPTDRAVEYHYDDNLIVINEEHPLFDTLRHQDDFTENIEDAFKEILAGRLLIHGYLRNHGADKMALAASRQIFDSILRSAAGSLGADELDYQLEELKDSSMVGGTRFENAIVDIFRNLNLSAAQEGGPDTHDGILEIPQVGDNYRASIEAKGSKGIITNKNVGLDDVNRHRVEQGCDHAVIIARDFQIDGKGDQLSALLRNLDPDINDEAVANISLLTTDALEIFLRLHYKQPFTYSETIKVMENEELPNEIGDRIIEIWESKPDDQLTRKILEAAHEFMEEDTTNRPSVGALTMNEKLRGVPREQIIERLEALEKLTDSIFMIGDGEFELDGSPDNILQEVDEAETNASEILRLSSGEETTEDE